jgi:hypothetical protein
MTIIPIISDLQVGCHDKRSISAVATFIADQMPEKVGCVGDVLDAWQVSHWCRGRAGEFDGQLGKLRDEAHEILSDLRVTDLSRSNHDDRIEKYVREYAPGLSGLPELRLENFLYLDDIGITFHRRPSFIAPGWLLMHGDEGSSVRSSGGTALSLARRTGRSVACGHTHKMGIQHDHNSWDGKIVAPLWGFEVGHLMDMKKASYLKAGIANWQNGFGVLVVDGTSVYPIPVPIINGKFYFDGKTYKG